MRKVEFDIVKAVAIYMVVWGHIATEMQLGIPSIINYVHMPVFFFISGYFLWRSLGKSTLREYVTKRIWSLLVPYVCWSAVSLIANVLLKYISQDLTIEYVRNEAWDIFILSRSCWFLIVLFYTSIFAGITIKTAGKYVLVFLSLEWVIMVFIGSTDIFRFYKAQWLFPFMILGILFAKYELKLKTITEKLITMPIWVVLYVAWSIFFGKQADVENYIAFSYHSCDEAVRGGMSYCVGIVGIAAMFSAALWIKNQRMGLPLFQLIGTRSMDIYVIHMFFIKFISLPFTIGAIGISIYSFILVVLISVMSRYLLEKVWIYRIVNGKGSRLKGDVASS